MNNDFNQYAPARLRNAKERLFVHQHQSQRGFDAVPEPKRIPGNSPDISIRNQQTIQTETLYIARFWMFEG